MVDKRPLLQVETFLSVGVSLGMLVFPVILGGLDHKMKKSLSLGLWGRPYSSNAEKSGLIHSLTHLSVHSEFIYPATTMCQALHWLPLIDSPSENIHSRGDTDL